MIKRPTPINVINNNIVFSRRVTEERKQVTIQKYIKFTLLWLVPHSIFALSSIFC